LKVIAIGIKAIVDKPEKPGKRNSSRFFRVLSFLQSASRVWNVGDAKLLPGRQNHDARNTKLSRI
jgi:hypothetical protein